jgi:serine/threonine protein kinase
MPKNALFIWFLFAHEVLSQGKHSTSPTPTSENLRTKKPSSSGEVIGEYVKKASLGSGVAGVVYEVEKGGVRYALKKAKDKWDQSVKEEFEILKRLESEDGFPRAHAFFKHEGKDCLVMDLVGPVVSTLQRQLPRFPPETVGSIGIQLVDRLESLHKLGLTHGDLYRNNMCPGRGSDRDKIFAIDFGQARTKRAKKFDAKSVLCTVVGLLKINENCSHHADYRKDNGMMKKSPSPISDLIKYVESLSSDSRIDYDKMRECLDRLVHQSGHKYEGKVIWPKELFKLIEH